MQEDGIFFADFSQKKSLFFCIFFEKPLTQIF